MSRGDRVRLTALVLLVALAALTAGISLTGGRSITGPTTLQALDPRCRVFRGRGMPAPAGQPRLNRNVQVTEALWCRYGPVGPAGPPLVELRATDGLDLVTAAFRQPDLHRPDGGCTEPATDYGRVWLRTSDGQWIEPRWPQSACGPLRGSLDLLKRAPFTVKVQY